jgi:Spy/CpxP family protein refolding chaperone
MRNHFMMLGLATVLAATLSGQRFGPRANGGLLPNGTPPDPATIVQNQVSRLTTLLSLTTAQAAQATTIFTNAQTTITPLRTSLATDHDALQTAIKSNATSTIDTVAANIGLLTGQIQAIQGKANAAFYAILTADQQAKLDQIGFGGFGPGLGGPHPPPGN